MGNKVNDTCLVSTFDAWRDVKIGFAPSFVLFIRCLEVATVSGADGVNGNFFMAEDLKRRLLEEQPRMSNTLFRKYIKKLTDGGIAKPTAVDGRYLLNPSFGLKGTISEEAYKRITKSFELGE